MISDELKSLLIQTLSSWQVIAVAVVMVLYFFLVGYVTQFQRASVIDEPKPKRAPKPKKEKKAKTAPPAEDEDAGPAEA